MISNSLRRPKQSDVRKLVEAAEFARSVLDMLSSDSEIENDDEVGSQEFLAYQRLNLALQPWERKK